MDIIRIEHSSDGFGFWHAQDENGYIYCRLNEDTRREISLRHSSPDFPTLSEDKQLYSQVEDIETEPFLFGFNSIEQLKSGFLPDELKEIIKLGFRVYLINADKFYFSKYQVIFHKETITLKKDITSLFE